MIQEEIIKRFSITDDHKKKIERYLFILKEHNLHTNLVGRSTIENIWINHVLDSLQIIPLITNKNLSILDMGSGAGLPGILLSIVGFKNVTLIDSNRKKTTFLNLIKKELNLNIKIKLGRIEAFDNFRFDIITSRALANLDKLFSYSQKFIKKNTVLIFLKGKTVNDEILQSKKKWQFQLTKKQSISDARGTILLIKYLLKNND